MDINELIKTLEQRRKGLAYRMWKEANLISVGISDLFTKKNAKRNFPINPELASPELYPQKRVVKIKKPSCLKHNNLKIFQQTNFI